MKSLFVMDPLSTIQVRGDSTYVTMRECCDRGYPVWYCTPDKLTIQDGVGRARATPVQVTAEAPHFQVTADEETVPLGAFDVVWMRKDPPFDMSYIFSTYVLDFAPRSTLVVNDPAGLKLFNEKLFAMRYPAFHPSSLLSRDAREIRAFVDQQDRVVLKPWDGNGGRGVVVTDKGDRNLGSLIELLTDNGKIHLIAQRYLAGIAKGDKRILLFDGEPVAAILRVPSAKDHRGNMHVGATVEPTELSPRERELCSRLGADLRATGMIFVGIDTIDDHLTEVNVTSPTGLQEANRLYGLRLEADLVDRVAARLAERRGAR